MNINIIFYIVMKLGLIPFDFIKYNHSKLHKKYLIILHNKSIKKYFYNIYFNDKLLIICCTPKFKNIYHIDNFNYDIHYHHLFEQYFNDNTKLLIIDPNNDTIQNSLEKVLFKDTYNIYLPDNLKYYTSHKCPNNINKSIKYFMISQKINDQNIINNIPINIKGLSYINPKKFKNLHKFNSLKYLGITSILKKYPPNITHLSIQLDDDIDNLPENIINLSLHITSKKINILSLPKKLIYLKINILFLLRDWNYLNNLFRDIFKYLKKLKYLELVNNTLMSLKIIPENVEYLRLDYNCYMDSIYVQNSIKTLILPTTYIGDICIHHLLENIYVSRYYDKHIKNVKNIYKYKNSSKIPYITWG